MRPRLLSRPCLALLPALLLAGACIQEIPAERPAPNQSWPEPAQPARPSQPSRQAPPRPPRAEARLVSTGGMAYEGDGDPRCVLHGEAGLQINLRTGDVDLPAVALRIAEYHGEGRYQGDLFLTGRTGGGALLGSTGTVEVQVEARPGLQAVQVLGGTFEGRYAGASGQGTVKGRFERCAFRPGRGALPQLAKELENPAASRPTAVPGGP